MKRNCKTKVNKGFTLVEMLMVIAILTVLLAFAVPGVSSYTRRIRLMELDDSARSIFMAAQNRLVSLKSAGVTNLTFGESSSEIEFENIPEDFIPEAEDGTKIEVDKASVDMRYITSDEIKSIGADEPNIIGLGGGASNISTIEDNLLQNDFIIEYEANTGYVFGVFYCEEDDELEKAYDPSGIHRDFEQRLVDGGFIGYYGGGELVNSLPAANPQQKPQVEKSSNEKLAINVKFPEGYEQDKVYFSVTITGYDYRAYTDPANKDNYKHTVAIISKDDKCFIKKPMNEGDDTSCTVILDSIAPGMSSDTTYQDYYGWWLPDLTGNRGTDGYDLSGRIIERDFKGWVYAGYFPRKNWNTSGLDSLHGKLETFYLLDSEDCFRHYVTEGTNSEYPNGGDVKYNDTATHKWSRWDYTIPIGYAGYDAANPKQEALNEHGNREGYNDSVYYIIDPGSNITVDYKFYDINGVSIDAKGDSWDTNSYFEKLDEENGIAYVSAGRHLQNLAFYTYAGLISKAYITKTIDFSEDHTDQPDCYEYWNSAETNKGTERAKNLYDFVPIDNKFVGLSQAPDILPDPNAADEIMIKYIRIDSTTYRDKDDPNKDPNILQTFTAANHETTGFFTTTLNREMTGLVFYCPVVIGGGKYTGSVVGKSAKDGVHLKNVTVINPIVEGPGFVGGICGAWTSSEFSNNRVLIEEVEDYFDNYNEGESLWQNTRKEDLESGKCKDITWGNPKEDPYAKFYVKGTSEDSYAGGLIGCATDQVQKASAAIKVESLGYAGGLIGVSSGGTFSKNFVGGHTYNGQFAGVLEDGTKYALKNISGEKGAGGIIGKVASYIDLDKDTVAEAVVGEGEITLNGAYSTCSVYSPNLENADVMVGSGKYYAQNNSYGAGWIVDSEGKKVSQAPRGGELNPQLAAYGNEVCFEAYDEFITKFNEKYPYYPQGAEHIGDWPVDPPVFGVFYWEKAGGEIRYKAIGYNAVLNENIEKNTLSDSGEITDYGYGYFYSKTTEADENKLKSLGENNEEVSSAMKTALEEYIAEEEGVGCDLTVVSASTKNSSVHSNQELSFSYRFGDSSGAKSYFFNPDFCGVGESFDLGARKAEGEEPYEIRCEQQLKNIANSLGSAYKQGRDITVIGDHEPIGSLSGGYFSGKYDGSGKAITLSRVKTADLQGIGLFGVTRNADLENIKVNYSGANVNLLNFGKKVGFGGVVGIAIGGNINNCEVTDVSVTATNNSADLAIGGIAGYSSANIADCAFGGGSETFKVDASNNTSAQYTVSVGGIAGSASGRISGTYNPAGDSSTCMVRSLVTDLNTYMKTEETDLILQNVIFAGGIAGNNVDFIGGTHLEVSGCVSHATLRRGQVEDMTKQYTDLWGRVTDQPYRGTIVNSNIFISPIAPTEIDLPTNLLDHKELFYNTGTNLDSRIQDFWEMILKLIFGDSSSGGKVSFVTGSGVLADGKIDTNISNCYYYEGMDYYDSLIGGGSGAQQLRPSGEWKEPSLDDVNLIPPGYIPEHREQEKPIVGLYSLYEKPDGSLYAKVYYNGENVNDNPRGDLDPLERYGVIASLGRIDDTKLSISVSKGGSATAINTVGKVYSDLDGNPISKSEGGGSEVTYFDFSDYVFDEPGTYTVTAAYDGEPIFNQTVTIAAREPYVGIYELLEELLENGGIKQRISGSYTDRKNVGFLADGTYLANKMTAVGDIAGEYGIMIEHSLNKPRSLGDVTVKLNGEVIAQSRLDPIGVGAYASNSGDPKSYGKMFDFYKFDDELIEALAEGKEFTIEVCPNEGGEPLAKETFTKNVKIPHLGLFGVLESDPPLKARVVYREPDGNKVGVLEYNAETGKKFMRYGVMLEKGFDVTKLKVELYDKDGSLKHTVLGENLTAAANYDIVENKGKVDSVNGKKYNIYKLDEKLTEKVYSFKITYASTEEVSTELNVDVEDDLKGSPTGHHHQYDENWQKVDEKEHEHFCIDKNCDDYEGSREVKEHEMRDIVVKSPTTEPGLRRYWCVKCDYEYTEEFNGAPYVGIFATYYKYKVDDSVEVGEGEEPSYILDESTKYLAYIVTGNDNIKVLPDLGAGEYYKLTGKFGVILENNVNKDQFSVQKINGAGYKSDKLRTFPVAGLALVNGGEITPGLEFYTLSADGNINKGDSVNIYYAPDEKLFFDTADFKENIPENVSGAPVERAGIYVRERGNYGSYNNIAWYPDGNSFGNDNAAMILCGEAGVLVQSDSVDLIKVYVDGDPNPVAVESDSGVPGYDGILGHYEYGGEGKNLVALKINPKVFGYKEEVTITIKQGKTTIFSKTVRIREKIGPNVLIYRKRANYGADVWYPAKKPDISNSEYIAEIGVAMPEDYIPRGVKVFVEEKEVTDLKPEGNPGIDTSQFAGYNLTTYKIPDSYTKGLEFVTVKIVYNEETLQSQRIQIREHVHDLSEWRQAKDGEDVNFHYQDCTDQNCDDMYFKKQEEHKKDEGVIINEATETEDGLIQYTCPVCQYKWPVEKYKYEAGPPKMAILFVNKVTGEYFAEFSDGTTVGSRNIDNATPCIFIVESSRADEVAEKLTFTFANISWGEVENSDYDTVYDDYIPSDLSGYTPIKLFDKTGFNSYYYNLVVYYNGEEAARFIK